MYYMIITYPGSGNQILMHGADGRAICATEENKELLVIMGKRLLNENLIASYQLLLTAAPEENSVTKYQHMIDCGEISIG